MNSTKICLTCLAIALITGLCVAFWISKPDILFLALGILLLSSVLLLVSVRRGGTKKSESIDKGKKLAEAVDNPLKSKQIAAGMVVYICGLLVAVIFGVIEVIHGNAKFITSIIPIIPLLLWIIIAFSPRKCYIYENGIDWRSWFIKWDEVKDFEWKNGVLKIKAKHIRRELLIEDEKGSIRKIVERMMRK